MNKLSLTNLQLIFTQKNSCIFRKKNVFLQVAKLQKIYKDFLQHIIN